MLFSASQFFSEKATSLEFMDMHMVNNNHFNNQDLVQISLHLSQINEAWFFGSNQAPRKGYLSKRTSLDTLSLWSQSYTSLLPTWHNSGTDAVPVWHHACSKLEPIWHQSAVA